MTATVTRFVPGRSRVKRYDAKAADVLCDQLHETAGAPAGIPATHCRLRTSAEAGAAVVVVVAWAGSSGPGAGAGDSSRRRRQRDDAPSPAVPPRRGFARGSRYAGDGVEVGFEAGDERRVGRRRIHGRELVEPVVDGRSSHGCLLAAIARRNADL